MARDEKPKEQTAGERKVMQEAADKRAAEFAAIRLRVLGPTRSILGPQTSDPSLDTLAPPIVRLDEQGGQDDGLPEVGIEVEGKDRRVEG